MRIKEDLLDRTAGLFLTDETPEITEQTEIHISSDFFAMIKQQSEKKWRKLLCMRLKQGNL